MTHDELVERVARWLAREYHDTDAPWSELRDHEREDYRADSRALIAIIRPAALEEAKAACEVEYQAAKRDMRDGLTPLRADTAMVQVMLRLDAMAKEGA